MYQNRRYHDKYNGLSAHETDERQNKLLERCTKQEKQNEEDRKRAREYDEKQKISENQRFAQENGPEMNKSKVSDLPLSKSEEKIRYGLRIVRCLMSNLKSKHNGKASLIHTDECVWETLFDAMDEIRRGNEDMLRMCRAGLKKMCEDKAKELFEHKICSCKAQIA